MERYAGCELTGSLLGWGAAAIGDQSSTPKALYKIIMKGETTMRQVARACAAYWPSSSLDISAAERGPGVITCSVLEKSLRVSGLISLQSQSEDRELKTESWSVVASCWSKGLQGSASHLVCVCVSVCEREGGRAFMWVCCSACKRRCIFQSEVNRGNHQKPQQSPTFLLLLSSLHNPFNFWPLRHRVSNAL